MAIITLTTDFGEGSPYVAEMKGVILSIHSEARIVDITHSIPPQNIRQGALALEQTTLRFPPDSIHVAVVDPGVGTDRNIVYACIDGRHYIAPDNGLLGLIARRATPSRVIALTQQAYWRDEISNTFHGRDIMAPVAAHLSRGARPSDLGEPLASLAPLDWPEPAQEPGRLRGEVVSIDSFGNLITNLEVVALERLGSRDRLQVRCRGRDLGGMRRTYGEAAAGDVLALVGSNGRLEIAVTAGRADAKLGAGVGEPVDVVDASIREDSG